MIKKTDSRQKKQAMKEKILSLKESVLGDMGPFETILILIILGSTALLVATIWFTPTSDTSFLDVFFAKPLSDMTTAEFIAILFIFGLIFRK